MATFGDAAEGETGAASMHARVMRECGECKVGVYACGYLTALTDTKESDSREGRSEAFMQPRDEWCEVGVSRRKGNSTMAKCGLQ